MKFQNLQEDGQNDKGRNKISKRRRGCLKKNSDDIECDSKELHELMFRRYPILSNCIGENSPISLDRWIEEVFERNVKCNT